MSELKWISLAKSLIGITEKVGKKHNPVILRMWETGFNAIGQQNWVVNDETPWCGAFVAHVLAKSGLSNHIPKQFPRALSWSKVGTELKEPAYGCVVVFSRNGGGHVGFCLGKDGFGNIMVLGGNQGNAVNIKPFKTDRVVAYRWCGTQKYPAQHRYEMPLLASNGRVSTNEA